MKIKLILLLLLTAQFTSGKSWQISNVNPAADYQNLLLAHAQAQDGDTLYVEGTGIPYDGLTLTKKLVLIGPGYFLSENSDTHFNKKPALIQSDIIFETGSSGSKIMGFDLREHEGNILIKESTITLLRNRLNYIIFNHKEAATYRDILISGNYIHGNIYENGVYNYDPLIITNLIISNNFINQVTFPTVNTNITFSALIENNVIIKPVQCNSSIIRNNIILEYTKYYVYIFEKARYNDVYNNIFTYSAPTDMDKHHSGSNNQWLIDQLTLFVEFNGSTDGQWQLRANSPASGAGSNGSNCGMFGGLTSYQLSGLPPVPVVYEITGPDVETGKVTVKARAVK